MFSEDFPNFRFEFKESEAIDFIEKTLKSYSDKYNFYREKSQKILQKIKQKSDGNDETPVMVVNDYKQFFELLRQFYERDIELFFLRTGSSGFHRYEKDNCLEQIWLRATPEDFNNPEEFLKKQVAMINDTTFEKYDEEVSLGKVDFLDNNVLCVKNGIARTWDENSREMEITIYDKNNYGNKELFFRPHYTLPVIRYGIYGKNGKKVCFIGSIQDKSDSYERSDLNKKINRKSYKANEGVIDEDTGHIEPKKLLALSIFINLLNKEGITEIEVPSLYVLDYEYHAKRNKQILNEFEGDWDEKRIKKYPELYQKRKYYFERSYQKEDLISEIKTERLLLTFRRLLQHYHKGNISSYPGDADSYMHLNIPIIRSKNDIHGRVFKELYELDAEMEKNSYYGKTIPGKTVRKIIFDILIERSNAIDDACNAMIEKEMNEIGVISEYTGEIGWTACGTRVLADDILDGSMSLEEAVEVLSSEERREAKVRCQKWLNEQILAYDCDGEEVEEFRILRYPFSAEVENWKEEPNVEPRFYCAIKGENGKNYLISVYDDYHTEAIRKFEKIKEEDKVPTIVKNISEATNYEVAVNGITGQPWYYDRNKQILKEQLAELTKQANDKKPSEIDDGR